MRQLVVLVGDARFLAMAGYGLSIMMRSFRSQADRGSGRFKNQRTWTSQRRDTGFWLTPTCSSRRPIGWTDAWPARFCLVCQAYRRLLVVVRRAEHKLKHRAGVASAFGCGRGDGSQRGYAHGTGIGQSCDACALGCMVEQVGEGGHWVASRACPPFRPGRVVAATRQVRQVSGDLPRMTTGVIAGQTSTVAVRRLSGPDSRKGYGAMGDAVPRTRCPGLPWP